MFGQNLKKLRARRGLKQRDIAAALGIDRKQLSKWENERTEPDMRSLCLLADYYGVSIDYIVGHVTPLQGIDARIKKLLDSLTPEQVSLLCVIAENALRNKER